MKKCEHLVEQKELEYQKNDIKLWNILRGMTVREIALSTARSIAQEAGIGRNTLYRHRAAYRYIVDCRLKEAERLRRIREEREND